eukprot:403377412
MNVSSPLLNSNLTPGFKVSLNENLIQGHKDRMEYINRALDKQVNVLPKSPQLISGNIMKISNGSLSSREDQQIIVSGQTAFHNKNQMSTTQTQSFVNLSMRNANKTLNGSIREVNLQKDSSFLKSSRESMSSKQLQKQNTKPQDLNQTQITSYQKSKQVAQTLRFSKSKSPPQSNNQNNHIDFYNQKQNSQFSWQLEGNVQSNRLPAINQSNLSQNNKRVNIFQNIVAKRRSLDRLIFGDNQQIEEKTDSEDKNSYMKIYDNYVMQNQTNSNTNLGMDNMSNYKSSQDFNKTLSNACLNSYNQSTAQNSSYDPKTRKTSQQFSDNQSNFVTNITNQSAPQNSQTKKLDERPFQYSVYDCDKDQSSKQQSQQNLTRNLTNLNNKLQPLSKVFNPTQVKLKLKTAPSEPITHEVSLNKNWLKEQIPHIAKVIKDVKEDEGVEITINCNIEAFSMIIEYLQSNDLEIFISKVTDENCLNLVVSSLFLGLEDLYQKLWRMYFSENFIIIINKCTLNLKNISQKILEDITKYIEIREIAQLKDRKDKFVSQIYRAFCENIIKTNEIQACKKCYSITSKQNFKKTLCHSIDNYSYIAADGSIKIPHQLDKSFDMSKFLGAYRDQYRVCWKETYLKLNSIVYPVQICNNCDQKFTIDQIGDCRYHAMPKPVYDKDKNENIFICCMKIKEGFNVHKDIKKEDKGCRQDFHEPLFSIDQDREIFEEFKSNLHLIASNKDTAQVINDKYQDKIQFAKAMSLNYHISFDQAYRELNINNQSIESPISQRVAIMDDVLFKIPEAANKFLIVQNDSQIRNLIAKQAKAVVRSRSPNQMSTTLQNLVGTQIRVTLDVDSNHLSLVNNTKRSLSPQQIKEVQTITRQKIGQSKLDIIRDDDRRSMKILSKILRQQRPQNENEASLNQDSLISNQNLINKTKLKIKQSKNTDQSLDNFLINIDYVSDLKIIKSGREILKTSKPFKSQERKQSPSIIIKQKNILRKASPNY